LLGQDELDDFFLEILLGQGGARIFFARATFLSKIEKRGRKAGRKMGRASDIWANFCPGRWSH
jgi:hypothetical protein